MDKLATELKKGSIKALAQFFDENYIKVYNFCFSFLRSKEEAEEVTQDVFIKIWKSREQINVELSLNGLLFKVAKNLTLNRIRDIKKFSDMYEISSTMQTGNTTMEEVLYREMELTLKKGIDDLPDRRKMIFELSRFEGLSNKEIGERMNISVNTVEGQIRKAIKQLHSYTTSLFD
ncbi:RNA polymerase sigma-70 factor [uncultured Roseivirga sp.]|uniref:RNA polymerase sigma-70 factor n=1 Tax=uncultured Roseivirga sp. TaxID=543088 RepID=UPI0030D94690|tara:strand:+ start:333680 stop:334207 length:528 start_codon:yes stop_codon:yes gene_type:complete